MSAESEGFEPSVPCRTSAFEADAFDHSANSPEHMSAFSATKRWRICHKRRFGTDPTRRLAETTLPSLLKGFLYHNSRGIIRISRFCLTDRQTQAFEPSRTSVFR